MMKRAWILIKAQVFFFVIDSLLLVGGFPRVYRFVQGRRVKRLKTRASVTDLRQLLDALDRAVVLNVKQVRCLQYAAATACFLRSYGFPASMVIGVRQRPFSSHAWVEMDGQIIGGAADLETYRIIDRC